MLTNCKYSTAPKLEMIINSFLYTFNFHHKSYINKDSFNNNLFYKCHRCCICKHEPQALFLPSSFHPRFPVAFCIDEFIFGFKRMHHAIIGKHTFSANNKKNTHTRLGFKCLIDSTLTIDSFPWWWQVLPETEPAWMALQR